MGNAVTTVTLTATPTDDGASVSAVTLGGTAIADTDFTDGITVPSLVEGANVIVVTVTAEDGSTEQTYTVTVTRAGAGIPVTIEAEHDSIGGGVEDLKYTLTRTGATTDTLTVTVTLTQDDDWLKSTDLTHEVQFAAGEATKELKIGNDRFSFEPDTLGNLVATVTGTDVAGGTDTVTIISIADPPITIAFDKDAYTFPEGGPADEVDIYLTATLHAAFTRKPSSMFSVAITTEEGTATASEDYATFVGTTSFNPTDFTANPDGQLVASLLFGPSAGNRVTIVNDGIYEGDETFNVQVGSYSGFRFGLTRVKKADGTFCTLGISGCTRVPYPVTITDDRDLPMLSLAAAPTSIAEEDDATTPDTVENVSTLTASISNAKTFAADQTLTLAFGGDAIYGTHYAVTPADTDGNTTDHQVTLVAGQDSVSVTVTAAGNTTADGPRSIIVSGSGGGNFFGTTIQLRDDDTNASPTFTDGASTSRAFNETIGDTAVATAANIGTAIDATDTDTGDVLTYSLEGTGTGTDAAKFGIVTTSGQLQTKVGEKYDYETQTSYAVTVKVEDGNSGSATIAVTLNVTDQNEAPLAPGAPSVSATTGSTTSLDVRWTAPDNTGRPSISNYDLQYQKTTETGWTNGPQNETGTSASIGSLDAGTAYRVQVRATNAEGDSDWSTSETGSTNTPTAQPAIESKDLVEVSEGNSASLAVTLSIEPTSDRTVGISSDDTGAVTVTPSSLTFTSANWAVEQVFDISAVQDGDRNDEHVTLTLSGTGLTSKTVTVTVMDDDNPPGAPTSLTATADGQSEIDLDWTAPADNGGSAITGYKIEASSTGNSGWSNLVTNTNSTTTTYSHTGLSAGTTRHYRVSAINSVGTGTASSVADATTDDTATTVPGAPTSLTATASGSTGIDLSWTAPADDGGSDITGYRIEVSPNGTSSWNDLVANTGSTTTYSHTGLDAGDTRHYRVSAINSVGTGAASNVADATTDAAAPTVPGAPTGLTATASGTSTINLSWDAPSNDGGASISGYRIEVSSNGGTSWSNREANTNTTTTTYSHTGLDAGTTRHYRVSAINSVGTGTASSVADATTDDTATTVPGAPTSLSATASGTTAINLSWTAPADDGGSDITGYRIEVSPNGTSSWNDLVANTGSTTTYSHTGLDAGDTRHYRVSAINSVGTGTASSVADATTDDTATTVPGAPTSLTATASGTSTIDLTWNAPSDDGGASISGYKIEVSSNGGTSWSNREANTNNTTTTYAHTGLSAGTTRHYRVSAINSVGTGAASSTANATTDDAAPTEPGAPTGLTATASGTSTIDLTWNAPSDDGDASITGYKIEVSPNGSSGWSNLVANTNNTTTTYSHTGLSAGTTRHYRVSAINSVGTGTASSTANATTDDAAPTEPGAPTGLTATASGTSTINLTWNAPSDDGGASISGYKIEVSSNGGTSWSNREANTNNTTTTYAHTGLSAGTTRHYRVSAINSVGTGAASSTANATTDDAAPTEPGAPTGLTATASGTSTINLDWTEPADDGGASITGYKIEVSPNGSSSSWTDLVANTGTTTTYSHTGLSAGTTRHYRVSAINSAGTGAASNVDNATTATTVPGAPTSLTATASGTSTIDLTWNAPSDDGGASISGYKIEVSSNGGTSWSNREANTNNTTTTYAHTGLSAGTTRHYRVSAINSVGTGAASSTANATTDDAAPTEPGAPTGLTATASGTSTINLDWTEPADDGGASITGYKIEVSPNGSSSSWTDLVANTGTTTTYSHTGLSAGTTRHYRVSAINSAGTGAASNVDNATTATTVPGAPTSLTATASGTTAINLSWNAPSDNGGASITGYRIEVSPNGSSSSWSDLVANTNNTTTTYSHTGLSAGTTRHYRVSAINSVGTGTASSTANATTDAPTEPGAPTGLTATASGTSTIDLDWTEPSDDGDASISGYKIEVSSNGGTSWSNREGNTGSTSTSYAHTGLSAGTTRHYRVSAINSVGTGAASSTANATTDDAAPTEPGAPTGLTATASGTSTINLDWTEPADDGGASITGYKIEVSPNGSSSSWTDLVANTGTSTSYAHTGLSAGTTRHYRVSAINSAGTGAASNVDNATTATTVPGAPTSLTATASGTTAINLSWNAPSDNGGASISGYKIEVSSNGGTSWSNREGNTGSTSTSYAHTGLSAGTTRHYRVSAINSVGTGTASSTANATTDDAAPTEPGAPTGLTATASGTSTINLDWTEPADDGGASITGYKIEVSPNGSSGWSNLVANTNNTTTTYSHTGLSAGTTRHYRVSAINSVGTGTASSTANATTDAPTEPGAPTGLTATASGTSTIDLDWTEPSDDGDASITGYRIEVSPNGSSGWSNLVANTNNTTTTYSHTGLSAGTTRHYRVSAINSVGTGTASSTANATANATTPTEPGAPTGLTATASGTSTIDLDWTEPSDDGGASITGYRIEVSPNGSSSSWSDLVANTNNTTTTYSHTGLSAGTTRHYRVSAINSVGTGTASSTANATTPTEPGAPTGLTATASGTSRINLTWTEPSDDGDASITGYTIEVSPNGSSGWSNLVGNTNNTTTTYSHTGLSTGTTRHYRVSAINSAGTGTASRTANATTGTDTGPLVLTVQAVSATVTEGEPVRYRILMSRPTSGALVESEYSYEGEFVHNGPASVFTGVSSQNGMTYWEIEYETLDDAMVEEDGSFTVRILKPDAYLYNQGEAYTVGTPSSATVTILDNDPEETPTLPIVSVFDVRVDEGPGAVLAFPVRLNVAAVETATIEWETLDGSAKAGQDYKGASGTLVFSPGDTEKTVRVEVIDDTLVEGTEVMLLMLLDAQGAVIDDAVAKGTINDNDAASDAAEDALEDALALVDDLTPGVAAAVLLGEQTLGEAELAALDRLGNGNGRYDLGDLLSWIDRCRRGEARCGRTSTDSGPAAAALLGGAAVGGRSTPKRPGRRDSGCRGRASTGGIRRRARMAGQVLAVLLAATTAWSCTEGSVAPVAPKPDPGFLTVEWSGPATHRDVGVLLELEGPTIDAVRAPGLELYESSSPGPRRIVVAGVLRPGPLVQLRVPDRNQFALYRVRVLQVTGEGYGLRDPTEYRAVVIMN